jgi:Flp pilus assembly protein TadD
MACVLLSGPWRFPLSRLRSLSLLLVIAGITLTAGAADLRINLPKRTKYTPVQQLNRDGVKALEKRDFKKARQLFYKAYLLDPDDPFTLNNLGYVSELEGDIERAQRYYSLAADMSSEAMVDKATRHEAEGKPVAQIAGNAEDNSLQINRLNVAAMSLLTKDRVSEAEQLLGRALQLDQRNPFTLNNIGYTREKQGELDSALSYYSAAAALNSKEPISVTANNDWRGRPISDVARRNASKVRDVIRHQSDDPYAEVARLNTRGVYALNRNDRRAAREYFEKAYRLDQENAFTLNNMGYLAELDGDKETAQFYYDKAREAEEAGNRIGVATRKDAEGKPLADVAQGNNDKVDVSIQSLAEERRRQGGPVVLKRRDNTPVVEPATPPRLPASDQGVQGPPQTAPQQPPPPPQL